MVTLIDVDIFYRLSDGDTQSEYECSRQVNQ